MRRRSWILLSTWSTALALSTPGGALAGGGAKAPPPAPAFDCAKVTAGSIEALICSDGSLAALDRQLAAGYAAATKKAVNEHPPVLKAEQRGWIKGRDACWKQADVPACVGEAYTLRMAELQARYRLLAGTGPVRYRCDGDPTDEIVATFFPTDPPTLIAERGDSVSWMVLQRSGSGARYQGRNESFWEHQGEATVTWGYGAAPKRCTRAR